MRTRETLVALLLAATSVIAVPTVAHAATLSVCSVGAPFTTIQDAISAATAGDRIEVCADTFAENIVITVDVNIVGSGTGATVIDGQGIATTVVVPTGVSARLAKLTVTGGEGSSLGGLIGANDGGGIFNEGTLDLYKVDVTGNNATGDGGGVYNNGIIVMARTTVDANTSDGFGGGVFNDNDVTVRSSEISHNFADDNGGGILSSGATHVVGSHLEANTARTGGAISHESGSLTVRDSSVVGNVADTDGGGLANSALGTVVARSEFRGNMANEGGAIYNFFGELRVSRSEIKDNHATVGGGILSEFAEIFIGRTTITDNHATLGGGVAQDGFLGGDEPSIATIYRSKVARNHAEDGAGVSNYGGESSMLIWRSRLANNIATDNGGGLHNDGDGFVVIDRSNVRLNEATAGAGIRNVAGTVDIQRESRVARNAASDVGAGIFNNDVLLVSDSGIRRNSGTRGVGIFNNFGSVNLTRSDVSFNEGVAFSGGGIANFGPLDIVDSRIRGNSIGNETEGSGGGIWHAVGTLTLDGSTVSGNHAYDGAGIRNISTMLAVNSTISGNEAYGSGGGIYNGNGAGPGESALQNVTVADNTAALAGGGIFNEGGSVALAASIVATNSTDDCSGGVLSAGYNVDGDGTCALAAVGDLSSVDPMLGPLANNGGPTPTHGLAEASPARDIAPLAVCPGVDQRDVVRPTPAAGLCDAGAFEGLL